MREAGKPLTLVEFLMKLRTGDGIEAQAGVLKVPAHLLTDLPDDGSGYVDLPQLMARLQSAHDRFGSISADQEQIWAASWGSGPWATRIHAVGKDRKTVQTISRLLIEKAVAMWASDSKAMQTHSAGGFSESATSRPVPEPPISEEEVVSELAAFFCGLNRGRGVQDLRPQIAATETVARYLPIENELLDVEQFKRELREHVISAARDATLRKSLGRAERVAVVTEEILVRSVQVGWALDFSLDAPFAIHPTEARLIPVSSDPRSVDLATRKRELRFASGRRGAFPEVGGRNVLESNLDLIADWIARRIVANADSSIADDPARTQENGAATFIAFGTHLATPSLASGDLELTVRDRLSAPEVDAPSASRVGSTAVSSDGRLVGALIGTVLTTAWVRPSADSLHLAGAASVVIDEARDGGALLACRSLGHAIVTVISTATVTHLAVLSADGTRSIVVSTLVKRPVSAAVHCSLGVFVLDIEGTCRAPQATSVVPFGNLGGIVSLDGIDAPDGPVLVGGLPGGSARIASWRDGSWVVTETDAEVAAGRLVRSLDAAADSVGMAAA
ncbi:hypothetical protein GCM10011600_14560 [Pseudolysinimonas yzui]|uniref:Uncharacterized protein n=2 Tax=Pseudolysinimonas yzui TaxID=2708254 RepID=A0A8J3M0J4_9MICO|nr:hypothetical protein GCM10011600_14560 [Pseudolysinimonas yzui]